MEQPCQLIYARCGAADAPVAAYIGTVTRTTPGHLTAITATAILIALAATGCAHGNGMGTITGSSNSTAVQYIAGGSTGDGADDIMVTVDHSAIDGVAATTARSITPWRESSSAYGFEKPKTVTMTVASLVKNGWASCDIRWAGGSINTKKTGRHATATCVATLGYATTK